MPFWQVWLRDYPFQCKTFHRDAPRPEIVEQALGVPILRVPLPGEGIVLWGFETKDAADAFSARFGAIQDA